MGFEHTYQGLKREILSKKWQKVAKSDKNVTKD
jgi:hypothetical protein